MKALYFYLDSCGPCKFFFPKMESICKSYDMEVEKVNIGLEENEHYKTRFEIKTVPTIVVLDGEDEVFRHVGVGTFTVGGGTK